MNIPGFPDRYRFTPDGVLFSGNRRLKTHRHHRQLVYHLWKDGRNHFVSAPQLHRLVFGTDPARLHDYAKGNRLPQARLTPADVRRIRRLSVQGWNSFQIAGDIGKVSARHIRAVLGGRCWRHIQ